MEGLSGLLGLGSARGMLLGVQRASSPQHLEHLPDPENPHHTLEVVGQHVKTHLSAHAGKRSTKEVRGVHPELESTERVFHCSSSHSHALWSAIEPLLHGLKHGLILPTRDALIFASRTARFDRTPWGMPRTNTCEGLSRAQVL